MALVFLELGFETFLQREGIGGGAGKARQDAILIETADFARRTLDDDVAQGDLAVSSQRNGVAAANAQNGGSVKLFHGIFLLKPSHGDGHPFFKGPGNAGMRRAVGARRKKEEVSRRTVSGVFRAVPGLPGTGWRWDGQADGQCRWVHPFPRTSRTRRHRCWRWPVAPS